MGELGRLLLSALGVSTWKKERAMNVQQLIQALHALPPDATVLLEGDDGYSPLGGVSVVSGGGGLPDEVLLQPDMTPD
jgi:hypothetical protein